MLDNVSGCYHELKVAEKISKRDVKITNVFGKKIIMYLRKTTFLNFEKGVTMLITSMAEFTKNSPFVENNNKNNKQANITKISNNYVLHLTVHIFMKYFL